MPASQLNLCFDKGKIHTKAISMLLSVQLRLIYDLFCLPLFKNTTSTAKSIPNNASFIKQCLLNGLLNFAARVDRCDSSLMINAQAGWRANLLHKYLILNV